MEIIIKRKTPTTKDIIEVDGKSTTISILSVYFDVLTPDTAYVDNNNIGYFPIEIAADVDTPDTDIIAACEKWITDNDVLSHYAGKLRNRDEDIADEIAKKYSLADEIAMLWKLQTDELTIDSPEIVEQRQIVADAKLKYPKEL